MSDFTIQIFDGQSGELVEREMTVSEKEDSLQFQAEAAAEEAQKQAKAEARVSALAKLSALGLTEEEIAAL